VRKDSIVDSKNTSELGVESDTKLGSVRSFWLFVWSIRWIEGRIKLSIDVFVKWAHATRVYNRFLLLTKERTSFRSQRRRCEPIKKFISSSWKRFELAPHILFLRDANCDRKVRNCCACEACDLQRRGENLCKMEVKWLENEDHR
jgi:hypothetical protein